MLPRIEPENTITKIYLDFLDELRKTSCKGEIHTDFATRLTMAVDNSIYQVIPQAIIFPRSSQDVEIILQLAHQAKFRSIKFCPRGGGTSTNGQSLTSGIILDCSKHMREILELNVRDGWVRVQPGVVLDQLNAYLKEFGVCFAPEISPSNRATIGGMVNTDACGTGSHILGRTSDNVIDLTCVLNDGQVIQSADITNERAREALALIQPHQTLINEKFTSAPRTLNGYNLKKAISSLNYLFCGSEGTLAVITECKLKLTPIPKFKKLVVVKYRNFDDALRAVEITDECRPLVIEAIDEKLIDLAREDTLYFHIKDFIDGEHQGMRAVNLVEFVSNDEHELEKTVSHFCAAIDKHKTVSGHAIGYYIAKNPQEVKLLWELRKKSVGLISKKRDGSRRPIPFIEDTAVPPEKLAAYISEFKALLDQYNLLYGMYGHVDAGCVHVRPALDMKNENDEKLMQELLEKVVVLIEKFGGVLWGEHGHGRRSIYGERFFGKELFHVVRQIKTVFDPCNQLNPGKVATALEGDEELVKLDGPLRGHYDKQISEGWREEFASSMVCNGNGACFNFATADVMCPSYKVTKDRVQSPKGRATVVREWLRQLANKNFHLDVYKRVSFFKKWFAVKKPDFSQEVFSTLSGCLSCKGCASQCPLNVDVPEFKAKFLALYYQRYMRPIRDYLIAALEKSARIQVMFPRFSNWLMQRRIVKFAIYKIGKLVDSPSVSMLSIKNELKKRNAWRFDINALKHLSSEQKSKSVILLQDAFTSFYQPRMLLDTYDLLTRLGFSVYVAPFFENGKPLHVKGFLRKFSRLAKKNSARLKQFSQLNIPLVGIDPSITLTYRDEYQKVLGVQDINVHLLQEWLAKQLSSIKVPKTTGTYHLLAHCTEKTMAIETEKQWQRIFENFGLQLIPLNAGCCGMAGSYGHEVEHVVHSKALFDMDWRRYLEENPHTVLATGYSCRSQVHRIMGQVVLHPIQLLANCYR